MIGAPLNLEDLATNAGTLVPGPILQMMIFATCSGRLGMNTATDANITKLVWLSIPTLTTQAMISGSGISNGSTMV